MTTSWLLSLVALKTKQQQKVCYFLGLELTFMSIVSQLHKIQDDAAKLTTVIRKRNLQRFGTLQRMDVDRIPKKMSH